MCVGVKTEETLSGRCQLSLTCTQGCASKSKPKRRNNEERKEKAKDAARNRRNEESDYFEELEKLLPVSGPPPSSQQTTLDKTSVIRLSVAHLKTQDVLQNAIFAPTVNEELFPEVDIFSCIDGFSLILSSTGDIIYVSDNVNRYIGLTQVELLGQDFYEYVHPCDHNQLKLLTPTDQVDEDIEIFVRVKCTVTERGRMINLKQANYKPLKISGKARSMVEKEVGGVAGTIFLGLVRCVVEREVIVDHQIGVFITKHSVDMKIIETDNWMASVAGYGHSKLNGISFFELVHALDLVNVQKAFKNLKEHGQCETAPYRLLCYTGGFAWVQTKACLATARRGCNKGQTISCSHHQISEVMNKEEILSIIQMKKEIYSPIEVKVLQKHSLSQANKKNKQTEMFYQSMKPIQFEVIDDSPYKSDIDITNFQKSVIIEPRKIHENDQPILIPRTPRKEIASTQTSVIVRCQKEDNGFSVIPINQKTLNVFEEEEERNTKTATEGMFQINDPTESIFDKKIAADLISTFPSDELIQEDDYVTIPIDEFEKEDLWEKSNGGSVGIIEKKTRNSPHDYIDVIKAMFPVKNTQEKDARIKENEFFENMFRNPDQLENFAPHSGDQCVSISKDESSMEDTVIETVSFDDLVMLDFDDNFTFSPDFLIPSKDPTFDKNEVLIDPDRNAMWGSNDEEDPSNLKRYDDVFQHEEIMPPSIIWKEENGAKRNNIDPQSQTNGYKKGEFDKNQDENIFEPPTEKPICRPKMSATKRDNPSTSADHYMITKRFKPAVETMMNQTGYVTLDLNLESGKDDIDVVTLI